MSRVWMILNKEKTVEISNKLHHKEWSNNKSGVAEVIVLLELVTALERRGRHIQNSKIEAGFDNRKKE